MDPQNNRLSVIDTAGVFLESKWANGGFVMTPWPGGFDGLGRYTAPILIPGSEAFEIELLRYDANFEKTDTVAVPSDPVKRDFFEHRQESGRGRGFMRAGVPFQGALRWTFSPSGTVWVLITDHYRLFELAVGVLVDLGDRAPRQDVVELVE
jgi:hypothetical protein